MNCPFVPFVRSIILLHQKSKNRYRPLKSGTKGTNGQFIFLTYLLVFFLIETSLCHSQIRIKNHVGVMDYVPNAPSIFLNSLAK